MHPILAYLINLGWLQIGPPYIYININPILLQLGPLAVRWYGLMYVVGIVFGLWLIGGYTKRKGITEDTVYRVLWWCIAAGLIGGRLYFVVQQPDFVSDYLLKPQNILATWQGGMAFFGAIFLVIPTLIWRARKEGINPLVLVDAGVLFGTAGQIFGRVGNLINGDIIGYPSTLPWSTIYTNPNSWACPNPATCNVPVQPAAGYELLINLVLLGVMLYLARKVKRPGILTFVYLFSYCITQFVVFFARANDYVSFLGITSLKQAQWTSIIVFIVLIPIAFWVLSRPYTVPAPVTGENELPNTPTSNADEIPVASTTFPDTNNADDKQEATQQEETIPVSDTSSVPEIVNESTSTTSETGSIDQPDLEVTKASAIASAKPEDQPTAESLSTEPVPSTTEQDTAQSEDQPIIASEAAPIISPATHVNENGQPEPVHASEESNVPEVDPGTAEQPIAKEQANSTVVSTTDEEKIDISADSSTTSHKV